MAENIRKTPLGGLLRRGATGDVPPEMSAVERLRRYQESIAAPPKPLISPAASYIQQVARERAASPEQTPVVGFGDRAMSARQDEILRQAELNAIADMATPRLLDETSPARVTNFALRTGNEAGDNNRERSFLERMSQSGLLSTLQGMARAERQYGVGPLAAFSESALDVQAARGAAEQEAAETEAKVDIERLKNQPKPPKLSGEAVKLYDRINTSRANAALVQEMKKALTDGFDTGIIGTSEQAIKAIANAFNIPIGTSGKEDYNKLVAQLKTGMLRSGRLLKADFELLDQIIPKATTFRNKEQLLNSIRAIEGKANRQLFEDQQLLKTFGLPAGSGAMPSTMIRSRNN